jgi:hypothetical protein
MAHDFPYDTKQEHAAFLNTTVRSIDNWRNQPNGLPFTTKGRTPLFHREWTLAWLETRRQQKNSTKRRGRAVE